MPSDTRDDVSSRVFDSLKADTTKKPLAVSDDVSQYVQSDSIKSATNKCKVADTPSGPVHRPRATSSRITNAYKLPRGLAHVMGDLESSVSPSASHYAVL